MAFSSIPLIDLITDKTNAFTQSVLRRLRDNIETDHTHIAGEGSPIKSNGVAAASVATSKIGILEADRIKLIPLVATDTGSISIPTDNASHFDSLTLSIPISQDSNILVFYRISGFSQVGDPFTGNPAQEIFDLVLELDGAAMPNAYSLNTGAILVTLGTSTRRLGHGTTLHSSSALNSTKTLKAKYTSRGTDADSFLSVGSREFIVIVVKS